MALPSSGQLSFSAIFTEFTNGGCLEAASEYSLSAFAAAIGYVNPSIATSAFYGGECTPPVVSCECFEIGGSSLLIYADWTDCCGNEYISDPIQNGAKLCLQLDRGGNPNITFLSDGYYTATGNACVCGQSCGR